VLIFVSLFTGSSWKYLPQTDKFEGTVQLTNNWLVPCMGTKTNNIFTDLSVFFFLNSRFGDLVFFRPESLYPIFRVVGKIQVYPPY